MSILKKHFKKTLAGLALAVSLVILLIPSVRAEAIAGIETLFASLTQYVKRIDQTSQTILLQVTGLRTEAHSYFESWLALDDSDTTAKQAVDFITLEKQSITLENEHRTKQQTYLKDIFGENAKAKTPFANDLTYQTVLGQPFFATDPRSTDKYKPDSTYNYIKNAAGINLTQVVPQSQWIGSQTSQRKYINYYALNTAVQTFNAYIISKVTSETPLNSIQKKLIERASDANWFTNVATEKLGQVIRQILLYNSQIYVLMAQLLEVQKQLLTAQAMTNSLLMLSNQPDEETAFKRATGKLPE